MQRRITIFELCVAGLCFFFSLPVSFCEAVEVCGPISSPVTFEKISNTLKKCNVQHIEELLPLLPPDFRSRYVLVYSSRSLHGATSQFPRVIMFGLDARFILAFAGDSALQGYELLETIQFDDEAKRFQFRSISFPKDGAKKSEHSNTEPVISEVNPRQCMACHRQDLRPNWDTYAAWPGVYGSNDDAKPSPEGEYYQRFVEESYRKTGRYKYLERAEDFPDQAWYYDYYLWNRPNLHFNWLLSLLNSQTIARSIKENTKLYPFRYALLASLTCEDDFNDPIQVSKLIPSEITGKFSTPYRVISEDVVKSVNRSYDLRNKRQHELLKTLGDSSKKIRFVRKELGVTDATSRLRYIMEGAGVVFPEWSMEFGAKNYVFFAGVVGQVGELGLFLWRELLDPVADSEIYRIYDQAWKDRSAVGKMEFRNGTGPVCAELRRKSIAALTSPPQSYP